MRNKHFGLVVMLLLATCFTAACSGSGGTGAATANAGSVKSGDDAKPHEPVALTFFMNSAGMSDDEFNRYVLDTVSKKYPYITLNVLRPTAGNKIEDLIAAGTFPDIMTIDTYGVLKMQELGVAEELSALAKANNYDRTQFSPPLINVNDLYSKKGELFAIPWAAQYGVLYYNKDIFDKFGVEYPKDGMKWEDVLELGKKVARTDGNTQYYPLASQTDAFYTFTELASEPLVNPTTSKAQFNNELWKKVFQLYKDITDLPNNKKGYGSGRNQFLKDKTVAMLPDWGSYMSGLVTQENNGGTGMNWDLASFPTFNGRGPAMGPFLLMVCSQSKYKQESFQVISAIVSKENQMIVSKEGLKLPAMNDDELKKHFAENNPIMKTKNVQSVFKVVSSPIPMRTEFYAAANKPLKDNLKQVIAGKMDINTALRDAEEKANKAILDTGLVN
jgi:multiple sugar transport system substrate-binding protein